MIASNENEWKKYQSGTRCIKARLVQSGIDPKESFNTFRGILFITSVSVVIITGVWVWLC